MTSLLSFDATGAQFAWDSTSLSAYAKCPRYYQLSVLEGWKPNSQSVHLRFGGHYAKALETYYKLLAKGIDREECIRQVVHMTLIESWNYELDDQGNPIPETGGPWESLDTNKTRETLLRSIVWYLDHFENDECKTLFSADGVPLVEHSFAIPVDDDIILCGHIDRMVEYSGGNYVLDNKTTGSTITPRFFDSFTPDIQMSMYAWAGNIQFQIPVSGVIIDGAYIAVGFTQFARGFAHRPKPLLEEFYDNTMTLIELARKATLEDHFIMNPASCGNYGGCQFRRICSRSPEVRDNFLRGEFYRGPRWDPLQRR